MRGKQLICMCFQLVKPSFIHNNNHILLRHEEKQKSRKLGVFIVYRNGYSLRVPNMAKTNQFTFKCISKA